MNEGIVYSNLRLYETPDNFVIEPRSEDGDSLKEGYLVIDRSSSSIALERDGFVPEVVPRKIFGIVGVIRLVAGPYLIVITDAQHISTLNGHKVYKILDTDVIPYHRTTLYLNETQADLRFTWNAHVLKELSINSELSKYTMPIMHGFIETRDCLVKGVPFQLGVISRRAWQRAGTRFFMRGIDQYGHSANFVETEQILEYDKYLCAFVQTRGSIPLYWSQKPNLAWQPQPLLGKSSQDQLRGFAAHMNQLRGTYLGEEGAIVEHVIVDLVNRKGREKAVGEALKGAVTMTNIEGVKYYSFDFHKECKNMNWARLATLIEDLAPFSQRFKFFATTTDNCFEVMRQTGYFRTNCMDCLDRTNVVQSMIARESLTAQLFWLKIFQDDDCISRYPELEATFKNIWADNGDMCSIQYAGTGALKADFTRLGKRTIQGSMMDGVNASMRYFKNNFTDGFRQDAIDLFLGNFVVENEMDKLPSDKQGGWHQIILVLTLISGCMLLLSFLLATEYTFEFFMFWTIVVVCLLAVILYNGEEFVNKPKLKTE